MTNSLRDQTVEAMAKALYEWEASWIDLKRNPWDVVVKRIRVDYLSKAQAALDAVLEALAWKPE